MHLRRALVALSLLLSNGLLALCAAASPSDPDRLRAAAEEFDAGSRAYRLGAFEQAAALFESAFRTAPGAVALRMAIKARLEAGQTARAATLCARADVLYPDDPDTQKLTAKVLSEAASTLHKVEVVCEPSCTLSLDDRLVTDQPTARVQVYVEPGTHKLTAGWRSAPTMARAFQATAGSSTQQRFEAQQSSAPDVKIQAVAEPGDPTAPASGAEVPRASSGGLPVAVFAVSAGATVVVGGLAIWSGLDTQSNPGPDKVRSACAGLGPDCPEYQDGIAKEKRTNYLWIGTAAAGVATGLVAVFTDWGGSKRTGRAAGPWGPTVGWQNGLTLGASGRF